MTISDLQIFTKIQGISGASGLILNKNYLFLISDDSNILYKFHLNNSHLTEFPLHIQGNTDARISKESKPDFEAISSLEDTVFIFGSGSGYNRENLVIFEVNDPGTQELKTLSKLYQELKQNAGLSDEDFNIEGVVLQDKTAYFFNRGNGPKHQNGIFKVKDWQKETSSQINFFPIPLASIKNVPFGFTDACHVDDYIYFLASAENTESTYDDGEILGSGLGRISLKTLEMDFFKVITHEYKLEGITLFEKSEKELRFLLCEDADDGIPETKIFETVVKKP